MAALKHTFKIAADLNPLGIGSSGPAVEMGSLESQTPLHDEIQQGGSPMMPNGKSAAAAPKLSDDDHVEMDNIHPPAGAVNPEEDIMQLARVGDIQGIEKLYESGKFDGTYCDEEGITPLHVCS